ncbi:MAG: Rpn family recombination-promoting nuclease/putative transposase [bacterium]
MSCFIPAFEYLIWDASTVPDQEIKGRVMLRAALLALKYIFRKDLREHLPEIFGLLRDLTGEKIGSVF